MPNFYPKIFKITVVEYYTKFKNVSINDIIKIFNISSSSLFNWIKLYNNNELHAEKKQYTKKSKITPIVKSYIKSYVIKKVNFDYKKLISMIKRKFKISISKSSIYNILSELSITHKKIKNKPIIKNKKLHNKDKKQFIKKINNININDIISIDETSFDTKISADYGWFYKGKQLIRKTYIKQIIRYTLICAISSKRIIHSKLIKGSSNGLDFKNFIEELIMILSNNANTKYHLLMDNARIHHSKIVKNYIVSKNYNTLYNVPYSPEYNPIEQLFSKLKGYVKKYNTNHIKDKLIKNITKGLKTIKVRDLKGYYKNSLINI